MGRAHRLDEIGAVQERDELGLAKPGLLMKCLGHAVRGRDCAADLEALPVGEHDRQLNQVAAVELALAGEFVG